MTPQQVREYISQGPGHAIRLVVDNNPSAVYAWIKGNYPVGAFPNYTKGLEHFDAQRNAMNDFLVRKANESGRPGDYVLNFMQAIPYNPAAKNWTTRK